ncbi:LysR family transcriptional regulator [Stenoxybacter acetivorans]|uniref:LysR family transcriptional regulator n=1 Tax=Stenoxybacter acetivorans TaxID=422441 RepID=UPI00055F7D66|nr:LysR family transcriptional regulator [Stenoxybacter acetivorans]
MLHTLIKHDLKALQAFVAIVECQGVSAAQDRLNMSQSAISTHLAHLEESLGVSLCRRGRAGFSLTKAGYQLYEACTLLLQATGEFHRKVQNIKWHQSVLSGTLRIGVVEHLPPDFQATVCSVISDAYQHYPELRLSMDIRSPQEIETAVATNHLDLGIASYHVLLKNLHYHLVFESRQNIYCRADHPAAKAENLTLNRLEEDYVWVKCSYAHTPAHIGISGGVTTAVAHHVDAAVLFLLAGSHIGFLPEDAARAFVAQGLLVPLLPQQATYLLPNYTVTRPTPDPRVNWFLGQLSSRLP